MSGDGFTRRDFMEVSGAAGLAALSGSPAPRDLANNLSAKIYYPTDPKTFDAFGLLIGPASGRPATSGGWLEQWDKYYFAYFSTDGQQLATITHLDRSWQTVFKARQNVEIINDASQLPNPSSGISTLDASKLYLIDGTVDIQNANIDTIDINGATLRGTHAAIDTLLTTGAGPLLQARGTDAYISRVALSAPSGVVLDLDAQDAAAALADKQQFLFDIAVIADANDLGSITGYKAQSFKFNAFQNFDAGLTHDGDPQKVFYSESIFRNTADSVVAITLADGITVDVVDITGNYFYNFGSSPTALDVVNGPTDGGTNPVSRQAAYVRNFHGSNFTQSNILSGVSFETPGWSIVSSAPLADSTVLGDYSLDSPTATTISSQDTYNPVNGTTTAGTTERWKKSGDNEFQYTGKVSEVISIEVKMSIEAASTTIGVAIEYHNGTSWSVLQQSEMTYETGGAGSAVAAPTSANKRFSTNDKFRVVVKDIDGTNDITVNQMNVTARGK